MLLGPWQMFKLEKKIRRVNFVAHGFRPVGDRDSSFVVKLLTVPPETILHYCKLLPKTNRQAESW